MISRISFMRSFPLTPPKMSILIFAKDFSSLILTILLVQNAFPVMICLRRMSLGWILMIDCVLLVYCCYLGWELCVRKLMCCIVSYSEVFQTCEGSELDLIDCF